LKNNFSEFKFDVLDFDEFMNMCREVGAEPVIVVAADEYLKNYSEGSTWSTKDQLLQHAVEWVKYSNIKKKYNVKYWMIGNESWHKENINSTAQIYARDVVDFSKAMKAVDPTIKIIPNGNTDSFWQEVLTTAAGHIDLICISSYPVYNYRADYLTYRDTAQNLSGPVTTALNAVDKYATIEDRRKLKLIVAEYGPFDWAKSNRVFINNMGHNLMNFEMTGEQLCEPRVLFSCFWNTRWITNDSVSYSAFDALDKNGNFNANGYGLRIWGKFLGDKMVKTTSTLHIKTFASSNLQQKKLFLYIINKSDKVKEVKIDIQRYSIKAIAQSWELVGRGPEDTKPVWRRVSRFNPNKLMSINPTSITVTEFDLK
jgi:alpha-L-arabinofuranosidase